MSVVNTPAWPRRRSGSVCSRYSRLKYMSSLERGLSKIPLGEFVIARVNVAHQRHAVAEVQLVLVGQVAADRAAGPVALESDSLVGGNLQFLVDGEDLAGIGGESAEEVLGILVGAAEPPRDHHLAHAGNLLNAVFVGFRHRSVSYTH